MEEPKSKETDVELEVEVSDKGLSMKAKGAGTMVLLGISISGIVILGYFLATTGESMLMAPILFLLFITYQLINILHAIFKTGAFIKTPSG